MIPYRLALTLALLSLTCGKLTAGPPLLTQDTGTPGAGQWEVNLAWVQAERPGARERAQPLVDVNYGPTERTQLKYEIAWLSLAEEGAPTLRGMSASIIGWKWRAWADEAAGWSASVFPQLEFRTPGSSSPEKGLAPDETRWRLPCAVQWDGEQLSLFAEVGREMASRTEGGWYAGLALVLVVLGGIELAAELNWNGDHGLHRTELIGNLAALVPVTRHAGLALSLGREFHNHNAPRATLIATLGCQLTF
ncbi:MAG: hypothetical protein JNG83_06135 [Opitutaceae bacterium]|nr:hypothetical protein [Opitutaceae bacterium]